MASLTIEQSLEAIRVQLQDKAAHDTSEELRNLASQGESAIRQIDDVFTAIRRFAQDVQIPSLTEIINRPVYWENNGTPTISRPDSPNK